MEIHEYDVLVIGAGGAGLRAAIETREQGLRTAVICKSLFGKAHTVMAEGGIAASMGNVNSRDHWKVHFRDTMRGGKFLNNWRMAELHAKESPERVWELETYGALFDRTSDGRISQRNFGGHEYPRLAHVGDRTGLELIRTLQQKIVSLQQEDERDFGNPEARLKVFAECTVIDLLKDQQRASNHATGPLGRMSGAVAYWRESGRFVVFRAPTVILATGGVGKSFKVTSNSWEYTGDGHALALRAGAELINMEFIQFHPTGMVWPPSVKGLLVTESVRGDGGVLLNSENRRFMFDYIPDVFRESYAEKEAEADRWYDDPDNNRRPPELLPRDEVARAINNEVKQGRGSPHGGVFLDVSSRLAAEEIRRRLPSMHHQFKELADVDITATPMEVGPTCHYVMGGVEVQPETGASRVPGLFAAGEVAGGMHGSNRLGGNSLSDLLVFGRRAGLGAAQYLRDHGYLGDDSRPQVADSDVDAAIAEAEGVFETAEGSAVAAGEHPYGLHAELQQVMNDLVGIIRTGQEMRSALDLLAELQRRAKNLAVVGHRQFNPGWHLALDVRNMLLISECIARAAETRTESRGGHTRDDYPTMDPEWRSTLLACSLKPVESSGDASDRPRDSAADSSVGSSVDSEGRIALTRRAHPPMRSDLMAIFSASELRKYLTERELAEYGNAEYDAERNNTDS